MNNSKCFKKLFLTHFKASTRRSLTPWRERFACYMQFYKIFHDVIRSTDNYLNSLTVTICAELKILRFPKTKFIEFSINVAHIFNTRENPRNVPNRIFKEFIFNVESVFRFILYYLLIPNYYYYFSPNDNLHELSQVRSNESYEEKTNNDNR